MTVIQRFGSALNLNIHFHLLVLDGAYELTAARPRFRTAPALAAPRADQPLAKHPGFSLHAGVAAHGQQRDKVERLCRYIARPAVP